MPIDSTFERWHIDFLKLRAKLQEEIIIFCFTWWIEAFQLRKKESKEFPKVLFVQILYIIGAPLKLVSDLWIRFTSKLILWLCEIFKVRTQFTSAYPPQTNSFCERINLISILIAIRAYTDKELMNRPKLIPGIFMALRNSLYT